MNGFEGIKGLGTSNLPLSRRNPKIDISEFTQQDGRKKRTANPLCVMNVTRPSLACFVANFTNIHVFWSFAKRSV